MQRYVRPDDCTRIRKTYKLVRLFYYSNTLKLCAPKPTQTKSTVSSSGQVSNNTIL